MIRSLARLFAVPDKFAMFGLVRGMAGQMPLAITSALLRCGVMPHLASPRRLEELSSATGIGEEQVLRHLLDLGVRRRVLRCRGGRYSARSRLARCVAVAPDGPVASMLQEVTTYHHELFDRLPKRLRGAPPRDYLAEYGEVVAQSSRIMEPWIRGFTAEVLGREQGRRVLELGCGSGAYLAHYAELHDGHQGVGLDFDPAVAAAAQSFLEAAGVQRRFSAQVGDMRDAEGWPAAPFDVITAHQNVYYFTAEERAALWRSCRDRLTDDGQLVIVTPTSGGPMSDYFALILLSTEGCHGLPSVDELAAELRAVGMAVTKKERLIPGDAVWGLVAGKSKV